MFVNQQSVSQIWFLLKTVTNQSLTFPKYFLWWKVWNQRNFWFVFVVVFSVLHLILSFFLRTKTHLNLKEENMSCSQNIEKVIDTFHVERNMHLILSVPFKFTLHGNIYKCIHIYATFFFVILKQILTSSVELYIKYILK